MDKEYLELIASYKRLRINPKNRKEAEEKMDKARGLVKEGKVSKDAQEAARYL